MEPIPNATRDTQLLVHTLTSTMACLLQGDVVELRGLEPREPSPAAQKEKVTAALDAACREIDAVLRSKKKPPAGARPATLARMLVERGERYDAVARTYTPGDGLLTLLKTAMTDAVTAAASEYNERTGGR